MNLNQPEPAPTDESFGHEVWPLVFDNESLPPELALDMKARHFDGVRKYGQPLRVWNGRDSTVDAYQEALDLVVYLTQSMLRLDGDNSKGHFSSLWAARNDALRVCKVLGELARAGAVPKTK